MEFEEAHNPSHDEERRIVPVLHIVKNSTLRSRSSSIPLPQIIFAQSTLSFSEEDGGSKSESEVDRSFDIAVENEAAVLDITDFECSLCFRLLCKPVTAKCGHTFCRNCLLAALKYSLSCPLCRTELPLPSKTKYAVNIILANLLEKHFREDYKLREKEDAEEEEEHAESSSTSQLDGIH